MCFFDGIFLGAIYKFEYVFYCKMTRVVFVTLIFHQVALSNFILALTFSEVLIYIIDQIFLISASQYLQDSLFLFII